MKWLALAWSLTFANVPDAFDNVSTTAASHVAVAPEQAYALTLDVEALVLKHLRLRGSTECYMSPSSRLSFVPYRQDYVFEAALVAGPFELGVAHECDHRVYVRSASSWYESGETQIYVRLSGKTDF